MRISDLVANLFDLYYIILVIRVLLSWLPQRSYGSKLSRFGSLIYGLTEPLLLPIRRALWRYQGGMQVDFSPLVLMLLIFVARAISLKLLWSLGL
ncbi:MAG: YggT family protein [Armatimonadia bacterium]